MTIGIDASRANKKERTGVEWYSYFLIQEFKKLAPPDVRVILYLQSEPMEDLLPLPPNWQIKILRWPLPFWTIFRLSTEMLLHKPDVFFSPANIIPFFAPKKAYTTVHDIGFMRFPACYRATERWLQNFGVKRAVLRAQKIFTPSEFTKSELITIYSAPPEKILVTPLGCNTKSGAIAPDFAQAILNKFCIQKPFFLYLGRKEIKKNTPRLLQAFKIFSAKNPCYSLVLVGQNHLTSMIPHLSSIISLNWLPSEDAQILLQNTSALVFPSLYEGFGLPILEAFAAEVPVITSNCASMPEVSGGAALLVNPQSAEEIAGAMEKIIKNPVLKSELINKGRERLKNFNWEKCAVQTIKNLLK